MNIDKILIPSELDELSAKVTDFAVSLAEQLNISEIVLLNLIIPAHTQATSISGEVFAAQGDMAQGFNEVLLEKHQLLAQEEAEKFTTEKVKIKAFARFNDSKTDLNKYMEEYAAGMVVCGSHDENRFLKTLFGSDTEKMVRKVDYPLIILQDEASAGEMHSILVAIDVDEDEQKGLSEISALAKALNARVQLLHVITDNSHASEQAIRKLHELATTYSFTNYEINVVNNDSLEDGIRSFVRKYNPDMIAVLSQGKGKIHKLIFGSSTQDIIKETDKPILVSKIR